MNLNSEVKALHLVELEYEDTIEQILPFFYDTLNKNQQIRIRQWIKKLSSVINNILWRKNRNLYAKLLLAMLKTKSGLLEPFNKCPPDSSLPKLSIYQIPFNLKSFIDSYEKQYKVKQENKGKSKSKFSSTQENKQNLIHTINDEDTRNKGKEKSMQKHKLSKTFQRSNSISQKRFSLTTESIIQPKKQKKTINVTEVNQILNETLQFLSDSFEVLMKSYKDHKSQVRQISRMRELILKINDFQEKIHSQEQETNDPALEDTGYQIIKRLFN